MRIRIRFLAGVCLALPLFSEAQEQQALAGYEAFAQEPAMSSASVSPGGEHLATLQRFAKDGKQFLLIYELGDMAKRPVTLGSDRMDIVSAAWANNERLIVRFRQDVDTLQRLGADTRQVSKLATVDRQGKRWLEIPRRRADRRSERAKSIQQFGGAFVFDLLPKDDDHILIEYDDDQNFVSDIFRVNVETGSAQRVVKNSDQVTVTYLDDDGDPRLAFRFDEGRGGHHRSGQAEGRNGLDRNRPDPGQRGRYQQCFQRLSDCGATVEQRVLCPVQPRDGHRRDLHL